MPYCKKCGEELPEDADFCPNCGIPVVRLAPIKPAPKPTPHAPPRRGAISRPTTVTAAAILFFIFGGLGVVFGTITIVGGLPLIGTTMGYVFALGLLVLVLGVVELEAGYGIWGMRKWGAILGVILCGASLVVGAVSIALAASYLDLLLSVVFDVPILLILAYNWRSFR